MASQNLTLGQLESLTYCCVLSLEDFTVFSLLFSYRLDELIKRFLEDTDRESTLDVGPDMRKIKYCFNHVKVCSLPV